MKRIALDKGIVESLIVMASVVEARDLYTGGQIITCPVCKGSVRVHMRGSDFEHELIGKNETYVPKASTIVASKHVEIMPKSIRY